MSRRPFRRLRENWDGAARRLPGAIARPPRQPHGQHLERLPVHGHVQHVALGVVLRIRHRPRPRLPRFEPGPARLRPDGPGPRPRTHPRHRRHAAQDRRRVPPISAAHQARQQRHRQRLQRRSALAHPRRRGLSQGNRRLEHPRRAGAVRERARLRTAALRTPAPQLQLHARTHRPARPAAHRPRRLERLPEPQLLLRHAGPVVPDHDEQGRQGRRVGLHRRPVCAGREGTGRHREKARAERRKPNAAWPRPPKWRRSSTSTAGTANGSCAPTTISASPSARRSARKARSSSNRRACASWPASA